MRSWPARRWLAAAAIFVVAAALIGVPTGVVPTPVFGRMVPVQWWNYPVWLLSSVLEGLLLATYVRIGDAPVPSGGESGDTAEDAGPQTTRAFVAGILSTFAVGCPVCNKLVVLALGVSGSLTYFAPAQPVLAVASLALLGHALVRRLRYADACPVPSSS